MNMANVAKIFAGGLVRLSKGLETTLTVIGVSKRDNSGVSEVK